MARMSRGKGVKIMHEKLGIEYKIIDDLWIKESLNEFQLIITVIDSGFEIRTEINLNLLQASDLRNRLTSWMNAKRYRDQRRDNGNTSNRRTVNEADTRKET